MTTRGVHHHERLDDHHPVHGRVQDRQGHLRQRFLNSWASAGSSSESLLAEGLASASVLCAWPARPPYAPMTDTTFPDCSRPEKALERGERYYPPLLRQHCLIAAVATHAETGEVLMFAWMKRPSPATPTVELRRGGLFQPLAERDLAQGRDQRPDPAGRRDADRLRPGLRLAESAAAGRRRRLPRRASAPASIAWSRTASWSNGHDAGPRRHRLHRRRRR